MTADAAVRGSPRAQELAEDFTTANTEAIQLVRTCGRGTWERRTTAEDWAVPSTGMHIAIGHMIITRWVHRIAAGLPITETRDDFAVANRFDDVKYATVDPDDVVVHLRTWGDAAALYVRGLSDAELRRSARFQPRGVDMTAEQMVESVLIGHLKNHLASIQAVAEP